MSTLPSPDCRKCTSATFFRGLIRAFDGEPEIHVYQCTKCTRMDAWNRMDGAWQDRRPHGYAGSTI